MAWAHVRSMTISIQDVPIKRAYAHADGSLYINVKAFYLLARSLGMATPLGRWIVTWYAKLEGLGVPPGQLVASSAVPGEMTVYCVTARALLSLLFEIAMARQTRPPIRAECLRVLQVLDSWGCHFDKPNVTAIVSAHGVEVPCIYARGQGLTNLFQILSLFDERGWVREEWDRARAARRLWLAGGGLVLPRVAPSPAPGDTRRGVGRVGFIFAHRLDVPIRGVPLRA